MSNQNSLFSSVKTFLNERNGQQFKVSDLIEHTTGIENVTNWKRWNNNPGYRTRQYLSNLRRLEFIKKAQNPEKKIYVIGEVVSENQGWVNSAFDTFHKISKYL